MKIAVLAVKACISKSILPTYGRFSRARSHIYIDDWCTCTCTCTCSYQISGGGGGICQVDSIGLREGMATIKSIRIRYHNVKHSTGIQMCNTQM